MTDIEALGLSEKELKATREMLCNLTKYINDFTKIDEPVYINTLMNEYTKYDNDESLINFAIFLKHWKLISKMCEEQREEVFMKGQEGE